MKCKFLCYSLSFEYAVPKGNICLSSIVLKMNFRCDRENLLEEEFVEC